MLHTHLEYVTFIYFHGNSGYTNARECYVYTHIARVVYNFHHYVFYQ